MVDVVAGPPDGEAQVQPGGEVQPGEVVQVQPGEVVQVQPGEVVQVQPGEAAQVQPEEESQVKSGGEVQTSEDHEHDEMALLLAGAQQWSLDEALVRNSSITRQDVEELRQWCTQHNVLPNASDYQLVAFLHSCEGVEDRVHSALRVYHSIRSSSPELFSDRLFHSEDVQRAAALGYVCILPRKTPEGYRIILQALRDPDPTDFDYARGSKFQFLTIDSCIRADPTTQGYIFINDMKDISMTHMWKCMGFRLPRKVFKYTQEGMPMRMKRVHFINTSPLADRMMRYLKPFLMKEVMSLLNFHTSEDMDDFFQMVPRHCMPEDYGGTLPPLEKLQGNTDWFLEKMSDLIP